MNFKQLVASLENKIKQSYEDGVTLETAEKLAGEFLYAQLAVSAELMRSDLDARMRKTGVKAVKAAIYIDAATKGDKKPTEAALVAIVDMNEIVQREQNDFDLAESSKSELERVFSVFKEAHVHFRQLSKGKFD